MQCLRISVTATKRRVFNPPRLKVRHAPTPYPLLAFCHRNAAKQWLVTPDGAAAEVSLVLLLGGHTPARVDRAPRPHPLKTRRTARDPCARVFEQAYGRPSEWRGDPTPKGQRIRLGLPTGACGQSSLVTKCTKVRIGGLRVLGGRGPAICGVGVGRPPGTPTWSAPPSQCPRLNPDTSRSLRV